MTIEPSLPLGHTVLFDAGPGAGKTALLKQWRENAPGPTHYLALLPEDADPLFFRRRFLQDWPEIVERFEALETKPFSVSWGALLGMAIGESHPDFCLLLDDFHLIEDTPLAPEILALCRVFPASGTLVLASRHKLPKLNRESVVVWNSEHASCPERPEIGDLLRLSDALLAKALALYLVGEDAPSPEGWELVRRNIAFSSEPTLQLRSAWSETAEQALTHRLPPEVWKVVAETLRAFLKRHLRTNQERRLPAVLNRLPSEVRGSHPFFLQLEGDMLLEVGGIIEARAYYQEALALAQDQRDWTIDLLVRLAKVAVRLQDIPAFTALLERIEELLVEPSPLRQAQLLYVKGLADWSLEKEDAAEAGWLKALDIPAAGDRDVLREQYLTLGALGGFYINKNSRVEAATFTEREISFAARHHFERDLLGSYMMKLYLNQSPAPPPIHMFTKLPDECFIYPSYFSSFHYYYLLGSRAVALGEYTLARQYLQTLKAFVHRHGNQDHLRLCDQELLGIYGQLRQYQEADTIYAELNQQPSFGRHVFPLIHWALILVDRGRLEEAEATLVAELARNRGATIRTNMLLLLHEVRRRQGDSGALDEMRTLFEQSGRKLWTSQLRLLHQAGVPGVPPLFRLRAFGPLTLLNHDVATSHWPRRKGLALLAHLTLKPEGVSSATLAESLFGDPDDLESLHMVAYSLRKAFRAVEGEELLLSSGGIYRLDMEAIAFCDLHEFDAFYAKAQSFEAQGMVSVAAMFFEHALMLARGSLFDNLPDDFIEVRAAYHQRIRHARAFQEAHGDSLE